MKKDIIKNIKYSKRSPLRRRTAMALVLLMLLTTGCEQQLSSGTGLVSANPEAAEAVNADGSEGEIVVTTAEESSSIEGVGAFGINSNVLPSIDGVTIDGSAEELAPVNLTVGVINSVVAELQQRLMDLGFMDVDEPTTYYGDATSKAVVKFQRQKGMTQDGITGVETWDALMADDAPHYAVKLGFQGDDITNIQYRLYNLGYLTEANQITGTFDESTDTAVRKMQEVNGLTVDGTVGVSTNELLYSEDVKANVIALGEQSDIVKKYQQRLIQLGYLTGEADGNFGAATQTAIRAFQSRNNQIVDGYLGPDTRAAMDSTSAVSFAMRLGEQSDSVLNMQKLLVKYGYLSSDKATGYFGSLTENALKSFQSRNGLTADGMAGAQTMAKLESGTAKKAASSSSGSSSSGNSSSGSSGSSSSGSGSGSSGSSSSVGSGGATVSGSAGNLISIASSKIGSPYVWGAKGPNSFDCSGFVYWCLNQAGVSVSYMTSSAWRNPGRFRKVSYSELQAGDIIVVSGHVGIVAGGGTVIDASSSNGRVVHRSLGSWWQSHFIVGWRIFS